MQAVHAFYNQLDVHLEASILDGTQNAGSAAAAGPPPLQPSSSFSSSLHHRSLSSKVAPSSSAPSSPKMHKREASRGGGGAGSMSAGTGAVPETLPFFSHTYNSRGKDAKPTIFEWDQAYCCLYPLVVPIRKCTFALYSRQNIELICQGDDMQSLCKDPEPESAALDCVQCILSTANHQSTENCANGRGQRSI